MVSPKGLVVNTVGRLTLSYDLARRRGGGYIVINSSDSPQITSAITEPLVRASPVRWESAYRALVIFMDLLIIAVSFRIGLVLTDASLAGRFPGFIAAVTGG